jgi:hypothetical protein
VDPGLATDADARTARGNIPATVVGGVDEQAIRRRIPPWLLDKETIERFIAGEAPRYNAAHAHRGSLELARLNAPSNLLNRRIRGARLRMHRD